MIEIHVGLVEYDDFARSDVRTELTSALVVVLPGGINDGTLSLAAISNTGDPFKWRFVVPAVSEPVTVPATPTSLNAQPSTTTITLTWSAVSGADTYAIHRSATSDGPWVQMATGLAETSWTNTGLPHETQYFYTVTAVNNLGSSLPSTPTSATTTHPFATFATWQQQMLGASPPQDQPPDADPDADGMTHLLEFAFLTDPTKPDTMPFKTGKTAAGAITLEFPWNWRANGLTWQLRHGHDLIDTAAWPIVPPGTITTTRDRDLDRITVSPAMAWPDRGFYVLEVLDN